MTLFKSSVPILSVNPSEARIPTPSVTFDAHILVGGKRLLVKEMAIGKGGLTFYRHECETLAAEFLTFPDLRRFDRDAVTGAMVFVWRLEAITETPAIELRAARVPDRLSLHSIGGSWSPACSYIDPHTETWSDGGTCVSIGVPDGAMMTLPMNYGWFPPRLDSLIDDDGLEPVAPFGPQGFGYQGGMAIKLPPLIAGERAQAHMAVAWAQAKRDRQDDSGTIAMVGLLDPQTLMASLGVT